MPVAWKWAAAAASLLVPIASARSAMGQVAWIADSNHVRTVDFQAQPPLPTDAIPNANAWRIAIVPGGQKVMTVDSREMLQSIVGGTVRQMPLAEWRGGGGIAITPDGTRAYLPVGNSVIPVDLITPGGNWALPAISGFQQPWDVVIAPDGKMAYVTDHAKNQVVPIALASNTPGRPFAVHDPLSIAITPDGRKLYVANAGSPPTVTPINLTAGTVSAAIVLRDAAQADSQAGQITVDPAGQTVFVAGDTSLLRIDAATDTEDDPIPLDLLDNARITAVAVSPDAQRIYAGAGQQIVSIDAVNNHVLQRYPGFVNVTSIAFAPPAYNKYDARVYFLGDSVTAGFGYCGQNENDLPGYRCPVNTPFPNSWKAVLALSLAYCAPTDPPDDRCSNNSYTPLPWSAPNDGRWAPAAGVPTIAYSYVIALDQGDAASQAEIRNWAITGSTPANWDPGTISLDGVRQARGIFADQMDRIQNSYVVMTLGANPLLDAYLYIIPLPGTSIFNSRRGVCATSVQLPDGTPAPLTTDAGGVGKCMLEQWGVNQQQDHLYNIFERLLENGNRVVVMGYPYVCPWSFGSWQYYANLPAGPASGTACNALPAPGAAITQESQAFFLGDTANQLIRSVVNTLQDPNIIFVPQSADWRNHQYYAGPGATWVFGNDTWVHPSEAGHRQLGSSAESALCSRWGHWCPAGHGNDVRW